MSILPKRPSAGTVIATVALLIALSGTAAGLPRHLAASNVAHGTYASASPLAYTQLTLKNGWLPSPFSTRSPAVAKDSFGIVHFKGAMSNGTTSNAFRLPSEFRPNKDVYVPVDLCNGISGRIIVSTDGQVDVQSETAFSDAQCFTSLEGASFAD